MNVRQRIYRLLRGLGFGDLFRWLNRRRVPVLMYHGVLPDDDPLAEDSWLQVRVSEFRWQMAYLKAHYEVVRLADLIDSRAEWNGRPRAVVTFDDGYANNFHWALPILKEFEIPATVFVSTGYVDTRRLFWWDRLRLTLAPIIPLPNAWIQKLKTLEPSTIDSEIDATLEARGLKSITSSPQSFRALTSDELRALAGSGLVDIGSHTHGHEILLRSSDEGIHATLGASVEMLKSLGIAPRLFAAPNGDYSEDQVRLIAAHGFSACVATHRAIWRCPEEPYRIPRFGVGRGVSQDEFALMISGCLCWLRKLRGKPVETRY